MLAYLAGIPLRLAHCRENPYQLLSDWVPDSETLVNARHEVVRQLDLVAHIGATTDDQRLSLRIHPAVTALMQEWLTDAGLHPQRRWCVLHPGATAESRRYPIESYGQVAKRLAALGFRLLVTGSAKEAGLVEAIAQECPSAIRCVDQFGLEEFAALIRHAPLLLTNNTGPAHIAAAVGTPVVDLYALTNPQHTPWQVPHRLLNFDVPCRNCLKSICPEGHHDCLRRVTPEQVCHAVLELWHACHCQPENPREPSLCIH
jgi:lipopolysaccharide heptosyltransferase II